MSEADSNNVSKQTEQTVEESPQDDNVIDDTELDLLDVPDEELLLDNIREVEDAVRNSDKNEALNLLLQGKRNILVKDYESAVTTLSDACQKFAAIYGDLGDECGEVYLTYGHALLELWRIEEKLSKNDNDSPQESDEKDELLENITEGNENGDDRSEEEKADDDKNGETSQSKDAEEENNLNAEEENNLNAEEGNNSTAEEENNLNAEEDEEEVDEEPDNLELAWEILELAKKIFERENGDRAQLAKVYSKLAEISIASNNYSLAIDDLKRSLEIQSSIKISDARVKANTHFLLYVAYSMNCNFNEADSELRAAKSTCQNRLDELDQLNDPKFQFEIAELKQIVDNINVKMRESMAERRKLLSTVTEIVKGRVDSNSSSGASSSVSPSSAVLNNCVSPSKANSNLPANNISHLIRKKPKQPLSEVTTSSTTEKDCNVIVSNGSSEPGSGGVTKMKLSESDESTACKKRKADDQETPESEPKKVCPEPV